MEEVVLSERTGAVLRLTINRPERRNALNEAVCRGLADGVDVAERTPGVRVVVITGAGEKAFCAGGDMKTGAGGAPFVLDPANPKHYVIDLFRRLEACGLPTIARVNGHALAGGLGPRVRLRHGPLVRETRVSVCPETRVGLFPMMILAYMMRIIPRP